MSNRTSLVATVLASAAMLAACGGDNGGPAPITLDAAASNPVDLSTPDAAANFTLMMVASSESSTDPAGDSTAEAKSARGGSAAATAQSTEACAAGGTQTESSSGNKFTVVYDHCMPDSSTLLDGVFVGILKDFSDTGLEATVIFGRGDTVFHRETLAPAGSERVNLMYGRADIFLTFGIDESSSMDAAFRMLGSRINSSLESQPRVDFRLGNASSAYSVFIESASDGSGDMQLNGPLAVSGACGSGSGTISTNQPIHFDSDGNKTAGQVTLSNRTGVSATVTWNADGTVSIVTSGGSRTYTAEELRARCNA